MAVSLPMIAEPSTEAGFYRGPGQYREVWKEHLIGNVGIMNLFSSIVDLFQIKIL